MIVVDTHVLVWWLSDAKLLSTVARQAIERAAKDRQVIASAISVLEIVTAVRRGRPSLAMPVDRWLADARCLPELRFEPVSAEIAQLAGSFGDPLHGDPADRLIAATALRARRSLVTADEKRRGFPALRTVW